MEEQRVNIVADLLDKTIKLGNNYRLDTRIVAWQSADILKINSSGLFREGEKWKVFVNEGGTARLRDVEIGHQTLIEKNVYGRSAVSHQKTASEILSDNKISEAAAIFIISVIS